MWQVGAKDFRPYRVSLGFQIFIEVIEGALPGEFGGRFVIGLVKSSSSAALNLRHVSHAGAAPDRCRRGARGGMGR